MKTIQGENTFIKSWCNNPESGAIDQARNLTKLPFVFKHVALMPDCHQGYGMPIGGVVALKGMVVPNAVGVDIGCGMCAVKTSLEEISIKTLKRIMGRIREEVPMGFNKHKEQQDYSYIPVPDWNNISINKSVIAQEWENAGFQIGTLGGGNHFIEIQKGSDGHIWIMIHSGSRNLGLKVAGYYNKLARTLNEKWHSSVQPSWDLAFLPVDGDEGQAYLNEMEYCVDFALANRKLMMNRIIAIFDDVCKGIEKRSGIHFDPMINIAHNYAKQENHCSACIDNQGNDNPIVESLLDDERVSKVQGFLNGYRPYVHSCGGLLLKKEASFLKLSPSQIDALEQMTYAIRSLIPGLELKHNHFSSLRFCECVSPDLSDEAYYTASNKFGLGFAHLFGVEKDFHKLDRVLGRIFLGFEAYDIDCKISDHTSSISTVMIHRKGATLASPNTIGIIPGSQGTSSYIVKGKGNPESYNSCSHGAGRLLSRSKARELLDLKEETQILDLKGVLHSIRGVSNLDEAPGAYKNIDLVMEEQEDLVEIVTKLEPLAVLKA